MSILNGHVRMPEGYDNPDAKVEVEAFPRSVQLIVRVHDIRTGSVSSQPLTLTTELDLRLSYALLEKALAVTALGYRPGEGRVEGHVLVIPFAMKGIVPILLASDEYDFVTDAIMTNTMIHGVLADIEQYEMIAVVMRGEHNYEETE